jgi:hypothetical protein
MPRDRFLGNVQGAVGMFTSMSRPWENDRQHVVEMETLPETPHGTVISAVAGVLAVWVTAVKAVLPDGFF